MKRLQYLLFFLLLTTSFASHDAVDRTLVDGKCGLASDKRVGLMALVPYFEGSSALLSLLLQSDEVASICNAGTWQCEQDKPSRVYNSTEINLSQHLINMLSDNDQRDLYLSGTITEPSIEDSPSPCQRCTSLSKLKDFFDTSPTHDSLSRNSLELDPVYRTMIEDATSANEMWRMRKLAKSIFIRNRVIDNLTRNHVPVSEGRKQLQDALTKLSNVLVQIEKQVTAGIWRGKPGIGDGSPEMPHPAATLLQRIAPLLNMSRKILLLSKIDTEGKSLLFQEENRIIFTGGDAWWHSENVLPSRYINAGITHILPRILVMWTPLCMMRMSSHRRHMSAADLIKLTAGRLENEVSQIRLLRASGFSVLVFSYADLLWRGNEVASWLSDFIPCIGQLDTNVTLSFKWVNGNDFKAHGTIAEFGRRHSRKEYCREHAPDILAAMASAPELQRRIHDAEAVLREYNRR